MYTFLASSVYLSRYPLLIKSFLLHLIIICSRSSWNEKTIIYSLLIIYLVNVFCPLNYSFNKLDNSIYN